ncbi:M10 family metallopeptidase C-terminal domain-containing protein [Pararhizobium sp. BT-229]|uniref:M10 family metallopeptidase C-terminal domain-containing protein n=1 Tax=Pararhizobium sp. BT-229 TaxID=2986923 RepID=UPI0021F798D5|nr:M10 family metallopeptidase C-terminal domain-containing protein [Pararhizobium sp. BT-229]MCV9967283.1 M10 family metallopeptidase C-terminal domain-containing protein [Pararhizobium sp. BT-229]
MADAYKPVALSNNAVLNGLIDGGAWNGPTVTYSFAAGDMNKNGISDFNEGDWKNFYREIINNIESFTQLNFKEVATAGNINFKLVEGGGGESGVPGPGTTTVDSIVGINSDVAGSAEAVKLGTFSLTWFHETGHALGLKHPHDVSLGPRLPGVDGPADKGTGYLNSQLYTVMGYTSPFLGEDNPFTSAVDFGAPVNAQPGSYGAIDIAALQHMYGARAHNTGTNSYKFSDDVDFNRGYTTIWDTGGVDTIEYVGASRTKIDLRAATLKAEVGGGGWISTSETLTGGYTIANGVVIENATGGNAADILIGNAAANVLSGHDGNDTLNGGLGADRLDGGAGNDTASYTNAAAGVTASLANAAANTGEANGDVYVSIQRLTGSSHADKLYGNTGANVLTGGSGNDLLNGGSGNDTLYGGLGADDMVGGAGGDTFLFKTLADSTVAVAGRDTIFDFSGSAGDRLDLSAIDANSATSGNQAFTYLGTAAFTGTAGELRCIKQASDTYVYGDSNGDKKVDFAIHLDNAVSLSNGDFVL